MTLLKIYLFIAVFFFSLQGCRKPSTPIPILQEMRVAATLEQAATPGISSTTMPASSAVYAGLSLEKGSPDHKGEVTWFVVDGEQSEQLYRQDIPLKEGNLVAVLRSTHPLPPGSYRVIFSIDEQPQKSRDFQLIAPDPDAHPDQP